MTTTAENVRAYLRNKPYLLEALEKGIVNLSELSRQIQEELKVGNATATKAALRRFAVELQRHKQKREEKVLQILKRSVIAVYDRKAVIITTKEIDVRNGMKVDLPNKFVYLLDRADLPERVSTLTKHDNCTMIVVNSPEELDIACGAKREHCRVCILLD
jgi:hypothetical protein